MYGTVAMVDGLVARLKSEIGADAIVVATGGLSELIVPLSVEIDEHDATLTLEGLRLVHDMSIQKAKAR
jgi:type III pantothenate kinase